MSQIGIRRERQVKKRLEEDGWVVIRAAGSLGLADLVALKLGETPRLIEVKSDTKNPWDNFRPDRRLELIAQAERAGAEAWVCWWPAHKDWIWFGSETWPPARPRKPRPVPLT